VTLCHSTHLTVFFFFETTKPGDEGFEGLNQSSKTKIRNIDIQAALFSANSHIL